MHHASHSTGGGWCVYDDWMLAVRKLRQASNGRIQKAMMIDLDIHQVDTAVPTACHSESIVHACVNAMIPYASCHCSQRNARQSVQHG